MNKTQLIGNLGADPVIRTTSSGNTVSKVANFTVATSERYRNSAGEIIENTDWHNVVAFGKVAEIIEKYLHKGSLVYVEGKGRNRKWTGNDGADHFTHEIVLTDLQLLDKKSAAGTTAQTPAQEPAPVATPEAPVMEQPALGDIPEPETEGPEMF